MLFICPGLLRWQIDRTQTRAAQLRYVGMRRRSAGVRSPSITRTCPAGLTGFISAGLGTVITLIKPDHSGGNWILEDISSHGEQLGRQTRGWMNVKDISAICDRAGHTPALASRDKETRRTSRSEKKKLNIQKNRWRWQFVLPLSELIEQEIVC